jgi:hypothetical protein
MENEIEKYGKSIQEMQEALKEKACETHGTKAKLRVDGEGVKLDNGCCDSFEEKIGKAVAGFIQEFGKLPNKEEKSKLI